MLKCLICFKIKNQLDVLDNILTNEFDNRSICFNHLEKNVIPAKNLKNKFKKYIYTECNRNTWQMI